MTSSISRKAFCARLAGGAAVLLVQACGGGGDSSSNEVPNPAPVPGPKPGAACTDTIAANHGHVLTIATADLDSLIPTVYNIQGVAAHNHVVTLALADLQALKAGTAVTVISSNAVGHEHSISILCV